MTKESFKDLFDRGDVPLPKKRRLSVGDEVEGVVGHVGQTGVIVDLGDNQQGYFELLELRDAAGTLLVKVGDRVKGFVVSTDDDQILLARRFGRESSVDHLVAALERGVPVEGKVVGVNKGGLEVDLGGARAFCPVSQIEDRFVGDAAEYVGRTFPFLVTKVDGRNVVVSRRALLERESREAREKLVAALSVGDVRKGRVTQLRDFGVFVDLGGLEGLIPLRELSHDRVKVSDAVTVGDVVEVQVKSIDKKRDERRGGEKLEVTLSLKALAADPWSAIDVVAPVGRVIAGQVTKLADFGAFVRIATGVEGLLHVSELGARTKQAADVLSIGQSILVRVSSVDPVKRRVSLAPAQEGATAGSTDAGPRVVVGSVVKAVVEKIENFGLIVQIEGVRGRAGRGVVPNAETGTRPGADLRKELPVGTTLTAKVTEASDGRTRLSVQAALADAERADYDSYRADAATKGMGTFGDLLAKKLGK